MNSNFKNIARKRHGTSRLLTFFALLVCTVGLAVPSQSALFEKVSRTLLAEESCLPANAAIDPGETNTVSFVVKNTSGGDRTEVKVSLKREGNVEFVLTPEQTIGNVAKDATFTVSFRFRAGGQCTQSLTPVLLVKSKDQADADVGGFDAFQLGLTVPTPFSFANTSSITINDFDAAADKQGRASVYPSTITVANVPDTAREKVSKVSVTLNNVTHSFSRDINVVLESPNGTKVLLISEAGGATTATAAINGVNITIDDTAGSQLPANGQIVSGTFRRSAFADVLLPGVAGPYSGNLDTTFDNTNVNGAWKLYVQDDQAVDGGVIAGGWQLTFTTSKVVCCGEGDTFPFITQNGAPGIGNFEVNEDVNFDNSPVLTFNVGDLEAGTLNVAAVSSNVGLIQSANIKVEGSGTTRTLKFKPEANQFGASVITVTVTDPAGKTGVASFTLTVKAVNDAPVISAILNQGSNVGTATPPIPFTLSDVESDVASLILTATSSDIAVVPNSNILIIGTGPNRTVTVLPANGAVNGETVITIRAVDPDGGVGERSFTVKFNVQPGFPTITPISDLSIEEDKEATIGFVLKSSTSTSVSSLALSASSDNPTVLPNSGITFGGSGADRTIRLVPAANQFGTARVTVNVTDAFNNRTTQDDFILTVTSVNDKPTITAIGTQEINEDSATGDIAFTIGDVEGGSLTVSAVSSLPSLIPSTVVTTDVPGIRLGGTGTARTIKVKTNPNANGKATITVTVTDANAESTSTAFTVNVNAINDPPSIVSVQRLTPTQDTAGNLANNATDAPIAVTINEDATLDGDGNPVEQRISLIGINAGPFEAEQAVTVTAATDHPGIISSISLDPATVAPGASTTVLKYKLVKNAYGEATVTLTLTDNGAGGVNTTVRKFKINVLPVNDAPVIAAIGNRDIAKNTGIAVPVAITDVETPTPILTVSATSSDTAVVANSDLIFDAANATLTVIPRSGVISGTSTITVTAIDRGARNDAVAPFETTTRSFVVTIRDIQPPEITISPLERTVIEDAVASFAVTLADDQDPGTLVLRGISDNPSLVPNENVLFGGSGASRTVAIVPAKDANGVANITIAVTDSQQLDAARIIKVTVTPVEDPPTLTLLKSVADGLHSANEDANPVADSETTSKLVEVEVRDAETASDSLVVTGASSNTDLVPNANIVISSTGVNRTVAISPAANRSGSSRITITVRDASGKTDSKFFDLTINAVNDAPTLNEIPNLVINEGAGQQTVNLAGIDQGAADEQGQTLAVTVSVKDRGSDPAVNTLITTPVVNYTPSGDTGNITFTPLATRSGVSVVTVTVTDNGSNADPNRNSFSRSFEVTINAVNDLPTITAIPDVSTTQNTPTSVLAFTINDVETPATQLILSAAATNPTLTPLANVVFTGSGSSRGVIVTPAPGQFGTSDITVTVTDANGGTRSDTFRVTVVAGQLPSISNIPDQFTSINTETDLIVFTVGDAQTAAESLAVSVASSNPTVVPNSSLNIQTGGSGATRLLVIKPAQNQIGSTTITVTVRDGDNNTASDTFVLAVRGQPPTISAIGNQTIVVGGSTGPIPFTVGDTETFAALLTVERASSNVGLIPLSNIVFGGTGANRTVTINAAAGQAGSSSITITVRDGEGQTASTVFTVSTPNSAPTISDIPNQTVNAAGGSTPVINFTVGDAETFAALLNVTATSNNPGLVPASGIVLGGSGANRTIQVTTAANQTGAAVITVTVSDGTSSTSDTFTVSVPGVNTPPTISSIGAQTINVNETTGVIPFTVGDAETPVGSLILTPTSSNTALVPNSNILLGGSGANRTVFVTPVSNQSGTTTITIGVSDGTSSRTSSFLLTVRKSTSNTSDFNGDGRSDIIYQDNGGFLAAWFMDGSSLVSASLLNPNNTGDPNWRVFASGDFNSDGEADLALQHTDGTLAVWYMNDIALTSSSLLNPTNPGDINWRAVGAGDFNSDGKTDLVFQHTDGTLAAWYLNGVDLTTASLLNPTNPGDINWRVVGVGDFNADGKSDLAFQHAASADLAAWYMNGIDLVSGTLLNPSNPGDPQYRVVGAADLNADGKSDLLFQHADGRVATWFMNGIDLIRGEALNPSVPGGTWRIVAP